MIAIFIGFFSPFTQALGHFGFADAEDPDHGIFWAYGIFFVSLLIFVAYRRWTQTQGTPEQRLLKKQLKDLDRALNACLKQIKNADEYLNECGISDEQRQINLATAESIQKKIGKTKALLAAS